MHTDFVAPAREIQADYPPGGTMPVTMHDGSRIVLRKVDPDYDPTSRGVALERIQQRMREGEHLTGLLYIGTDQPDLHALNDTPDVALNSVPYAQLNPGSEALAKLMERYR